MSMFNNVLKAQSSMAQEDLKEDLTQDTTEAAKSKTAETAEDDMKRKTDDDQKNGDATASAETQDADTSQKTDHATGETAAEDLNQSEDAVTQQMEQAVSDMLDNLPQDQSAEEQSAETQSAETQSVDQTDESSVTAEMEASVEASLAEMEQQGEAAQENLNPPVENATDTSASTMTRSVATKSYSILQGFETFQRHTQQVAAVMDGVRNLDMVARFEQVVKDQTMSSPIATAFRATPGFDQVVPSFPKTEVFNIIPEDKTSPHHMMALEAFSEAEQTNSQQVSSDVAAMVGGFQGILNFLEPTVTNLQAQIAETKTALESSDITDAVLATLSVHSVGQESLLVMFDKIEEQVRMVSAFDSEHLRSHPELLKEEVEGLSGLVSDVGPVLGIKLDERGLTDTTRHEQYIPTSSQFGDKGITTATMTFLVDKAGSLLEDLSAVATKKDELMVALESAAANIPSSTLSDEVTYGSTDHCTLMACYTTLVSTVVREAVMAVTSVLSMADAAVNIDTGIEA